MSLRPRKWALRDPTSEPNSVLEPLEWTSIEDPRISHCDPPSSAGIRGATRPRKPFCPRSSTSIGLASRCRTRYKPTKPIPDTVYRPLALSIGREEQANTSARPYLSSKSHIPNRQRTTSEAEHSQARGRFAVLFSYPISFGAYERPRPLIPRTLRPPLGRATVIQYGIAPPPTDEVAHGLPTFIKIRGTWATNGCARSTDQARLL